MMQLRRTRTLQRGCCHMLLVHLKQSWYEPPVIVGIFECGDMKGARMCSLTTALSHSCCSRSHSEVFIHPPTIFLFDFPNACQSTLQARQTGRLVSVKRARLWFCVTLRSWTTLYCCLSIDTAYKSMDDILKKKSWIQNSII